MRRNIKKKGALELSVNSIVIMVIAFVVLGLILTFTRTIFKFGSEKTTGIFEATSLETQPDADNPLTLPDTITVKGKGKKTMNVGFYNRNPYTAINAKFGIQDCQDERGNDIETIAQESGKDPGEIIPTITSSWQTIEASAAKGYKIIINENGLPSGKLYICTVVVYNNGEIDDITEIEAEALNERCPDLGNCPVYETKQIFLQIAA